jgi:hypothetical protein
MGDFNGDGIPDLAIANVGGSTISILLGVGDGTLVLKSSPATGNAPISLAVGDFNGDGIQDLAVLNQGDRTVVILIGNGDGTFQPPVPYGVGATPYSVVVGDFNGDGVQDLAVTNAGANTVSILLGNGNGIFTLVSSPATGAYPISVAVGDFNGDGIPDLATANTHDNTVSILLGRGDGTFSIKSSPATGSTPQSVAVGDFNGDGIPDLAVANGLSNTVSIFLGVGDGTFTLKSTPATGSGPGFVAISDFNGDGIPDLVTANEVGNTASILIGAGDGTFALKSSPATGNRAQSVAVGDFNGDGNPDIATANDSSNNVSVLLSTQLSTFSASGISVSGASGTHNIIAQYPGDSGRAASQSTAVALTVLPTPSLNLSASANPSVINGSITFTATVSSGPTGTITFFDSAVSIGTGTISGTTATLATSALGLGPHSITASWPGNTSYNSVTSGALTQTVNQIPQVINFTAPASLVVFGVSPIALSATGGASSNPVMFSVLSGPGTVSGTSLTITGAGEITVAANQLGNTTYAAATQVTQTITVNQATQAINFTAPLSPVTFGVSPMALTATGGLSANAVTFSVISGPGTISASSLTITGAGTIVVAANQAAAVNYSAAPQVTQSVMVNQSPQTITFTAPATSMNYGIAPFSLTASSTSGLAVTFGVSGPATLSGSTLTITGPGTVIVTANQPGTANIAVATQVAYTITVNQAAQVITFVAPPSISYGSPVDLAATSNSGLTVTFTVLSGPATISGTTLTPTGIGSVVIAANQAGSINYTAAPQITQSTNITQASQIINFTPPASPITFGTSPIALSATGGASGNAVTFSILSGPGSISGNALTIGTGTVVIAANQTGTANYSAAAQVTQTVVVNQASQSISFVAPTSATYGSPVALSATATSGLGVSLSVISGPGSISGGTLNISGVGTIVVSATQPGNTNYTAATAVTQTITVNKAAQTISFAPPGSTIFGTPVLLSASATSGLGVSFDVTSGPGSVSGNTLSISGAGSIVVTASQPGNANYSAATAVSQTIVVSQAAQAINFSMPGSALYGAAPIALSATGGASGNPVTLSVISGPGSLTGNMLTLSATGTVVVVANQAGSANYSVAPQVTQTITVSLASQAISFSAPSSVNQGVAPFSLSATGGGSGNPVTFSVLSGPGSISGNTLTMLGAGTIVVAANQAANTNYSAAPQVTQTISVLAPQAISFSAPPSVNQSAPPMTLSATGGASNNPVIFSVLSGPGSISGNVLTFSTPGIVVVAANQAGNTIYSVAPQATQAITVLAPQAIGFSAPAFASYGGPAVTLSATGGASSNPVIFSVLSGPGSISGAQLIVNGLGTIIVAANQAGNAIYSAAPQVTQSIDTVLSTQTITFTAPGPVTYGTASIMLTATGGASGSPVVFSILSGPGSILGNQLTVSGAGTIVAAANQAGTTIYAAAPQVSQSILVNQAGQSISFSPPSGVNYGTGPILLSATGGASNNPVTFAVLSGPGSLSGNMLTITGTGSITVAANQTGNANYAAATQVTRSIASTLAPQTISFAAPGSVTYGVGTISLSATGGASGNPVVFTFMSGPGSLSGNILTVTGVGTITIEANQAGNSYYSAAQQVTQSVRVNQLAPTITWTAPAPIAYGTTLGSAQLNASSTLPGTFVYSPAAGTVLLAGSHVLSVTFTPTDSVNCSSATQTVSIQVTNTTPAITWATPSPILYGVALDASQLNALAGSVAVRIPFTSSGSWRILSVFSATCAPNRSTDVTATSTRAVAAAKVLTSSLSLLTGSSSTRIASSATDNSKLLNEFD